MSGKESHTFDKDKLRESAEKILKERAAESTDTAASEDIKSLLHDLRVHQIELEMQNDELLRIQRDLESSQARYFELYDLAPVGYCCITENGLIVEANLAVSELLAVPRKKLLKRLISQFIMKEDQDVFYLNRKELLQSGKTRAWNIRMHNSQGELLWVRMEASVGTDDEDGIVLRMILTDVTERKVAEHAKVNLEHQLRQAQKMESVGLLAGGVAHDFNNMLSVILGQAELVLYQLSPDDAMYESLTEIKKAGERSSALTGQLMAYARKQTISPVVLDLNETIENMLNMLKHLIGEDIVLNWRPTIALCNVKMDPSQIDQIVANLCVNAKDAINGAGIINLETEVVFVDKSNEEVYVDLPHGEFALFRVSDNGCGIDAEILDNIFEPFFTTKIVGKGTGLGLSTVFGIVKQNSGHIRAESKPGLGSTFEILLPVFALGITQNLKKPLEEQQIFETATILIVEDEPSILNLLKYMLTRKGYNVLATTVPSEAIAIAEKHKKEISLLITDIVMPLMNGQELSETILSMKPNLKCLFMSGHTSDVISSNGIIEEGVNFIQKPFQERELLQKIQEILSN